MPPDAYSMQTFHAADGRELDVLVGGASPEAVRATVVMHHGTPSDATCWSDWVEGAAARGVQLVSISRPGYATSTRQPGRTVASVAADVATVLDALGVDEFVTAGWSGGGPHALACAALLPDRCRAVASLAGVGPYGVEDLDFLDGMGPENVEEFGAALEGEQALTAWMARSAEPMRHVTGEQIAEAFGGLVPQVDKDVLTGGYAEHMAAETRRALEHGFDGWIDDDLAFTRDWGFALADITLEVTVWQGDLDLMVPRAHGEWLVAHLPRSRSQMPQGHGHISLVTEHQRQILDSLLTAAL
jgi:pimeloyl-ACP methyl ester carboxylesterase